MSNVNCLLCDVDCSCQMTTLTRYMKRNLSCYPNGMKYNALESRPTRKAAHSFRFGNTLVILKTAENATGPPYLRPDTPIGNRCGCQLRRSQGGREPRGLCS